jgi:hypothetical protein
VATAGTGKITLEHGTGTNCGTGTTALTGAYNLTAQAEISKGGGLAPVLVVPADNPLCVVTSAAVPMSGSLPTRSSDHETFRKPFVLGSLREASKRDPSAG